VNRAARGEGGYTLVEMLTVVSIMSVVLTGLVTLFVQGSNSQLDMNRRFEAQQDARVALDKMRREIHCASQASASASGASAAVTLRLPAQCPTAGGSQTDVTWCSVNIASSRWALFRKVGTTCNNTGVRWADRLTIGTPFDYQTQSVDQLSRLRVEFAIDPKPGDATPGYRLCDTIVLRNSSRAVPASTILGYTDTASPASC
jgi:prepilin-type N-terminal cleavage/methylation domain-containing protein